MLSNSVKISTLKILLESKTVSKCSVYVCVCGEGQQAVIEIGFYVSMGKGGRN